MEQIINLNNLDINFIKEVEKLSGQRIDACYQCGNCTAGCPVASSADMPAHKIMRLIQLGQKKEVLGSSSIWLCLSCLTCAARCPNKVDLAAVMDALREISVKEGLARRQNIRLFEELFLDSIRTHGRLFEMGALMRYNLMSLRPFQDAELLLPLHKRKKLGFSPDKVQDKDTLEKIFKKYYSGGR